MVGATDWQRDLVLGELADLVAAGAAPPPPATGGLAASTAPAPPPAIAALSADTPAPLRAHLYASAGVVFATTRILCVDLLSGVAGGENVAGLLVLRAHRATGESGEGFAARLVRRASPGAWLRAVSDSPSAFTAGFARVERVMRALGARRLHLWPRFEAGVKADLAAAGARAQVVDLAVSLTPSMAACYEACVDLMEACLRELRRCPRLDGAGLTLDRGLGPAFDAGVARQLDAAWEGIPLRTKQAAADMRTLRGLAADLLALDCVSFLRRLEALRAADAPGAGGAAALGGGGWMLHDAAHALFAAARRRVYVVGRGGGGGGGAAAGAAAAAPAPPKRRRQVGGAAPPPPAPSPPAPARPPVAAATVIPVLEEQPKWAVVLDILREVQAHRERLLGGGGGCGAGAATPTSQDTGPSGPPSQRAAAADAPVLVVARDARTVAQLAAAAAAGGAGPVLRGLYEEWLAARAAAAAGRGSRAAPAPAPASAPSRVPGRGTPAERLAAMRAGRLRGPAGEEAALLREAEGGRRGGGGGGGGGRGGRGGPRGAPPPPPPLPSPTDPATTPHLLQGVTFACLDAHEAVGALVRAAPAFLVVVDPDVALVREVEVWSAGRPGWAMRVYHLRYEASLEADRYGAALAREGRAMEGLIEAKAHMAMPGAADDDEAGAGGVGGGEAAGAYYGLGVGPSRLPPAAAAAPPLALLPASGDAGNVATRVGGGGLAAARAGGPSAGGPPTTLVARATAAAGLSTSPARTGVVVVDAREFMSSLPASLHRAGLTLAPVTLEVGDYVLSPTLAIERKAIPDLRSSLASGRVLTQAAALARHYRTAALLIEFDGERTFGLDPPGGEGSGLGVGGGGGGSGGGLSAAAAAAATRSLPARLALLTLHAPRLRLLWARSPPAAARLFVALKAGSASGEPDPAAAAGVGVPDGEEEGGSGSANEPAVDLLRRLPGVTDANARPLMAAAGSLAGLAALSLADLEAACGGAAAGRRLRSWLDAPCPVVV